mgnify:CR=1 FL=1
MGATFLVAGCQTVSDRKVDPEKAVQARTQLAAEYIRTGDFDAAKRELAQQQPTVCTNKQKSLTAKI